MNYLSPPKDIARMEAGLKLPGRSTAPWDMPWRGTIITIDPAVPSDLARITRIAGCVVWRQAPAKDGRVMLHISWPNPSYTPPALDEPWHDMWGCAAYAASSPR